MEVSIALVSDKTIHKLNKLYRGEDKPTDVLSFTYNEGGLLGEILISIDTAKRQAKQLGHTLEDEITRLMVHGLVHLLGYDHEAGQAEKKVFEALEQKLMENLKATSHV